MPLNKRQREQMLACCGEIQDDDGIDPRQFFRGPSRQGKRDRKTQQLCRQVEQNLNLVLGGEFADELLQSLFVESVVPAPNASQLLVTVSAGDGEENVADRSLILNRLERVAGRLRAAVAEAITRKKTPRLMFQVVASPR